MAASLMRNHLCSLSSAMHHFTLSGVISAARMAFELPPRLRLEQDRRAEKQPKASNNSSSGPIKKGEGLLQARGSKASR